MVRINLLPVRVSKKKEAGTQQLAIFAVLLVAGLAANYLWQGSRASDLKLRQAKLARTKDDVAQLERIIGEVRNIKAQQQELQQKLDVLDRLKSGRSGPVRVLDEVATITPKQLWLSKMSEKGGAVNFTGSALSIDDVSAFMTALKGSKHFSGIDLKRTTATGAAGQGGDRVVTFEINATVEYAPASPAAGGPGTTGPAGGAAPKGKG
jgi:type IV pilus assembly protein PilN